jgi:hypothetical protein
MPHEARHGVLSKKTLDSPVHDSVDAVLVPVDV